MSAVGELLIALVILIGLVGTIVPMLPGPSLVLAAIVIWAIFVGGWAWSVVVGAAVLIVGAAVLKYLVAGRSMKRSGISNRTVLIGGLAGIVGFFVIPVIGLPIGFLAGAFVAEWARDQDVRAGWRGAVAALRAAGVAILIELTASLFAAAGWLTGAIAI
ncbi:DUF456 domain-containing protein [Williamsia sp.]|uniref:DUF456 domain-containing protein n=1 Tax=Williamsia sp. TaxID=1872085 RepID=UPI001A1D1FA5|nr:DUF456 domain-containing protein [Williamsia sp.]MBJ7287593.1 DUF456 domain-containing protein [Williamsia sp.]